MLRRFLRLFFLLVTTALTLLATTATFVPTEIGPYPSGYRDRSVSTFFVSSFHHSLECYYLTHPFVRRDPFPSGVGSYDSGQDIESNLLYTWHGFEYEHLDYIDNTTNLVTIRGHDFTIPWWMLALPAAALTLLLARPHLRKFLLRPHDPAARPCPRCAYDLRASTHTCPECGAPVHATPSPPP